MASRIFETIFILLLTGVIIGTGNMVGYGASLQDSIEGVSLVVAVGVVGYILSQLPVLNKCYMIVWVSAIAILISCPIFPGNEWIVKTANKVQFMAIATPILAYAGLSIGKDLEMFKRLSWRIIPVALAVCAGTFIFAVIIAQFALHWEGAI